jgi:iron-sulfur cluster assembly protein
MSDVKQHVSESRNDIELTTAARQHVLSYLDKQNSKGVRLSVKKTGCSGLSYVIDYIESPLSDDIVADLNEKYLLCIDKRSYPYLKGMKVDYIKEGLNHKFVFINPNQTGQCGCGESFTID